MEYPLALLHRRYQQQALWTKELRLHILSQEKVDHTSKILEVGCGTAAVLSSMNTGAQLFGLDIDNNSLVYGKNSYSGISPLVCGDSYRLPYESNSFEITFCHFLFLWLRTPEIALDEMIRVTKTGGKIIAFAEPDYGGRIDYPIEFEKIAKLQKLSLEHKGADTQVGRSLSSLFSNAKLKDINHGVINGNWDGKQTKESLDLEWNMIRLDLSKNVDPIELEQLYQLDLALRNSEVRVLYVPTFYAIGNKPEIK